MKVKFEFILYITFSFVLCCCTGKKPISEAPTGYRKLSRNEMIERARNGNWPNSSIITYKLHNGGIISKDSMLLLNHDKIAFDDYVDYSDTVKFAVIRTKTESDIKLRDDMMEAYSQGPRIKELRVNCKNTLSILKNVYERDKENRNGIKKIDPQIDFENLEVVVNILNKCDLSGKEHNQDFNPHYVIWLVIQHSNLHYQKKYLSMINEFAKNDLIKWENYCMTYDRIKLLEKTPQLYGTQLIITNDGIHQLYEVEDINGLDNRRKKMGLIPIDEYLKKFEKKH
jgi:hypothetical protein